VYALDPSVSRLEGAQARVELPYEPLEKGPIGLALAIDTSLPEGGRYKCADLDAPEVLRDGGYTPDVADPRFHSQMVYALGQLCRVSFCRAIGRTVGWAFGPEREGERAPLAVRPFGFKAQNAYYSREERAVVFGWFQSTQQTGRVPAGKFVFTSLSSDVVVHEFSHALLDAVRPHFFLPTNYDLLAFHEAFADLMALFQRFHYPKLIYAALRRGRGRLSTGDLFSALAPEFAQSSGLGVALRTFDPEGDIDGNPFTEDRPPKLQYGPDLSTRPHERGRILTEAVLEAFARVLERKIAPLKRLASSGTGVLPEGELPAELLELITRQAIRTADEFRALCLRALDYCPPIDMDFGDYLRAAVTADAELLPDDPLCYRETLIGAFRRRSLFPKHVSTLSETSLRWRRPECDWRSAKVQGLALSQLEFEDDPASPPSREESRRQAALLGQHIAADADFARELGLVPMNSDAAGEYEPPRITDIRPTRRVGRNGEVRYDLVAQVVQGRRVQAAGGTHRFLGGAAIMINRRGELRLAVRKRVDDEERCRRQIEFVTGDEGKDLWGREGARWAPQPNLARRLCER
jgi:hypothetical protein